MAKKLISALFLIYRWIVSPVLQLVSGPSGGCRFQPTCSVYAETALQVHGGRRGGQLAMSRILRCHPYSKGPVDDPVPPVSDGLRRSGEV